MADKGGERAAEDRISGLCDDLLLRILVLLPLVEAVRTCALSRRWGAVWTRLPRLAFHDAAADAAGVPVERFGGLVDGALARYAPDVDIDGFLLRASRRGTVVSAARLAAWAALAAERVTGDLTVRLARGLDHLRDGTALEFPCHGRASDIALFLTEEVELRLLLPAPGSFVALARLLLRGASFTDGGAAISEVISARCPCLETLRMTDVRGVSELTLRTASLRTLLLTHLFELDLLDVAAPNLRAVSVRHCFFMKPGTAATVCAPMLEEVSWADGWPEQAQFGSSTRWQLQKLTADHVCQFPAILWGGYHNFSRLLEYFKRVNILELHLSIRQDIEGHQTLMERVTLPDHSELHLFIAANGHAFGVSMVSMLRQCNGLRKFRLCLVDRKEIDDCPSDCACRQPTNWMDQELSLRSLEELVIDNFRGTQNQIDFLNFILTRGNVLNKVLIAFARDVEPNDEICDWICALSPSSSMEFTQNE